MQASSDDIEQVGHAIIIIGTPAYSNEQHAYLQQFLNRYAQSLSQDEEAQLNKIFHDKTQIIDAIKLLHAFALQYKDYKQIINEFNEELEDLQMTLNKKDASNDGILI